ncbi:unnamed protein product [Oppiella nova]|uniref:Uncharacterized protein n=1 Tax=Oppiella nova TaxID=334625 RepID=A0A7R9QEX2_9ACAR|nr:unnamed protein product [Oppiella nova]CAG2163985.1 unnamed protein product [Oppiella nova]
MLSKILILALVAVAQCLPLNDEGADKLVDQLLDVVKTKYGAQLDPLHLNDSVAAFSKKILGITFHGDAKLTEGTITGLKNLKRSGPSDIQTKDAFKAHVQFGDNNLAIHFKAILDFMDLHTDGILNAQVGNLDVKVDVAIDSKSGKITINSFEVDKLKSVKIDFHGPIPVADEIVDLIGEAFITIFNKQAEELVGKVVKDILAKELDHMKFPPQ